MTPEVGLPVVLAHTGVALDGWVLAGVIVLSWCYGRGARALADRAGEPRAPRLRHVLAWAVGVAALVAALAPPLEARADTLLSAHMVQHVLLVVVAAPSLAASRSGLALVRGVPHRLRRWTAYGRVRLRPVRRALRRPGWPFAIAGAHVGVLWLWHLPGPYELAVRNELVHAAEHLTMLASAVLLWWAVLERGRTGVGHGVGIGVLFVTALGHGSLGAVLTVAPSVLYGHYERAAHGGALPALEDQGIAGILMWLPGKALYGLGVVVLTLAWLRAVERRMATVPGHGDHRR